MKNSSFDSEITNLELKVKANCGKKIQVFPTNSSSVSMAGRPLQMFTFGLEETKRSFDPNQATPLSSAQRPLTTVTYHQITVPP